MLLPLLLQVVSTATLGERYVKDTPAPAPSGSSVIYVLVQYKQVDAGRGTHFDPNLALLFLDQLKDAFRDTTRLRWENTTESAALCQKDEICDVVWLQDSVAEAANQVVFTLHIRIGNLEPVRSMPRPWPLEPPEDVDTGRALVWATFATCVKNLDERRSRKLKC